MTAFRWATVGWDFGIGQDLKKIYSDETRIVENASLCSSVRGTSYNLPNSWGLWPARTPPLATPLLKKVNLLSFDKFLWEEKYSWLPSKKGLMKKLIIVIKQENLCASENVNFHQPLVFLEGSQFLFQKYSSYEIRPKTNMISCAGW